MIEVKNDVELRFAIGDRGQNAIAVGQIFRRNKPVGVELANG